MVLGTAPPRHHDVTKTLDDILAAADQAAPGLRAAMQDIFESMKGALPDIEGLLAAGDFDAVTRAISELDIPEDLFNTLQSTLASTAQAAMRPEAAAFGMAFNDVNPRAIRWASRHAAEQIQGIVSTTRASVNEVITEAVRTGAVNPRVLAAHIESLIGLTKGHARSVDLLFQSMIDNGLDPTFALRRAGTKADKLLRWRAETIARTETIEAANMGQQLVWDEALDTGLLLEGTKKVWMATGDSRTCRICAVLDGKVVEVRADFAVKEQATSFTRDGEEFTVTATKPLPHPTTTRTPPAHARCRCTMVVEDFELALLGGAVSEGTAEEPESDDDAAELAAFIAGLGVDAT